MYNREFIEEAHGITSAKRKARAAAERIRSKRRDKKSYPNKYRDPEQLTAGQMNGTSTAKCREELDAELAHQMANRIVYQPTLTSVLCGDPVGPHQQRWRLNQAGIDAQSR